MIPADLKTYLHLIEQAGQLRRIAVPVNPHLELATIVSRICQSDDGGPALLFEQVTGTRLPVAVNLFGRRERTAWALGTTDLEGLADRLEADLASSGERDPQRALSAVLASGDWQPQIDARPAWLEPGHLHGDLALLPAITAWPGDGGPYLTLAQVYTRHPDGGPLNCGMYRVQCHAPRIATIRCRPQSGAARHLAAWHGRGQAMPVAVALGGPPVLTWAAGTALPEAVEEAAFCGYLTGERLRMSYCRESGLQVPATADGVIEGEIAPGAVRREGPFGNHTGSYDSAGHAPEMRIASVWVRPAAVCPWTLVGPPPMENLQLARAGACLLLPLARMSVPELRSVHFPAEGIFHRAALVSVASGEERPLAELAGLLRGTLLLKGARLLVIGAADHDPRDPAAVFWRVLNRADWARDLLVMDGCLAIDARRMPTTGAVRPDPDVLQKVLSRWAEYRIAPLPERSSRQG